MSIHAIIQARMASTRLPGKVLKILNGKTLLERVVERAKKINGVSKLIVATTVKDKDTPIVKLCKAIKIPYFRGSEDDVLDRFVKTAKKYRSNITLRLTADNPFLEPVAAEKLIKRHIQNKNDYTLSFGYPLGTSCEVFNTKSLVIINKIAKDRVSHEHLGAYFLDHQNNFKIETVKADKKVNHPEIRLTIDTVKDFETAQNILNELGNKFTLGEIINLFKNDKSIFTNRSVKQVSPTKSFKKAFSGKNPLL